MKNFETRNYKIQIPLDVYKMLVEISDVLGCSPAEALQKSIDHLKKKRKTVISNHNNL